MKTTDPPIVVEQDFDTPIEKVWKAITQLEQMKKWFFNNIPQFKAQEGFKTQFNVNTPNHNFLHLWEITKVIPQQKLVYKWKYKGFKGNSFVTFTLTTISTSKTKLVVSTSIIEDFDDSAIDEFKYESAVAGWNYFIKQQLVSFLE